MKSAVTIVSLLLMMLGLHAFAGIDGNNSHSVTGRDIQQSETVPFICAVQHLTAFTNNSFINEATYVVCEEIEDEDESEFSSKKYPSQVILPAILFNYALLTDCPKTAKQSSSFWHQATNRYILHRTLRI